MSICVICQYEVVTTGADASRQLALSCGHRYHRSCVVEWLRGNPQRACPLGCDLVALPKLCYHGNDVGRSCGGCGGSAQSMRCVHGVPLVNLSTPGYANECVLCANRRPVALQTARRPTTPPNRRCSEHNLEAHPQCAYCILAKVNDRPAYKPPNPSLTLDQLCEAFASAHRAVTRWVSVPLDVWYNQVRIGDFNRLPLYARAQTGLRPLVETPGRVTVQILWSPHGISGARQEGAEGTAQYRSARARAIIHQMVTRGTGLQRALAIMGLSEIEVLTIVAEAEADDSDFEGYEQ